MGAYVPPPDPDFEKLAWECWHAWERDRPAIVAFDTETTGVEFIDTAFCVTVAWECSSGIEAHYLELEKLDCRKGARAILGAAATLVGHHVKFDLQKCIAEGILYRNLLTPSDIEDAQVAAHLLDENRSKGLKELAVSVLGEEDVVEVEIKSGPNKGAIKLIPRERAELDPAKDWAKKEYGIAKREDVGYHLLPRGVLVPYAIKDAAWTLRLWKTLKPQVLRYPDMAQKYHEEMELALTLLDMETAGLGTRPEYVDEKVREYRKRVVAHDLGIEQIVGKPVRTGHTPPKERALYFNPASSQELAEFFRSRGFDRESYNKEALAGIDHPLARALGARRKDAKLLSTYFLAIQREQRDNVLHPSFRQNVATGRMSSGQSEG